VSQQLALFGVPVLVVFGLWWYLHRITSPRHREYRRRLHALANAESGLRRAEHDWQRLRGEHRRDDELIRKRLDQVFAQCWKLERGFQNESHNLEKNREVVMREQHLRNCFISEADIPGIGATRKQLLASFGIETASDIEPGHIDMIKGFGKVLTANLMAWKQQMIKEFHFDPQTKPPEGELRTLALKYQHLQQSLFAQLEIGAADLERLALGSDQELRAREPELRQSAAAWLQAKAD